MYPPVNPPQWKGSGTATTTPAFVLPWTAICNLSCNFVLWVANDDPSNPVNVQFLCSPDGTNLDMDSYGSVSIPGRQSKQLSFTSEMRMWWAINVWTTSGTAAVRWGVTIMRT